jgi:autoinducer 2-degrading protein
MGDMLVVAVDIQVVAGREDEFREASLANARASLAEPGILRFDVLQDRADPAHFTLMEVYRDDDAPAAHKETKHYAVWRDTVADMMAHARSSTKFDALFPVEPAAWDTPSVADDA